MLKNIIWYIELLIWCSVLYAKIMTILSSAFSRLLSFCSGFPRLKVWGLSTMTVLRVDLSTAYYSRFLSETPAPFPLYLFVAALKEYLIISLTACVSL